MRKETLVVVLCLCVFFKTNSRSSVASGTPGTQRSLVGIVGDITCGREHIMMRGKSDAECTRQCVATLGSKYALITADKVYVLEGHWQEVDALAGQKARITG